MDSKGQVCVNPSDALGAWIDYFMQMEGGQRTTQTELRQGWIEELQHFAQPHLVLPLSEVPTLTDLELSYRRVPAVKSNRTRWNSWSSMQAPVIGFGIDELIAIAQAVLPRPRISGTQGRTIIPCI